MTFIQESSFDGEAYVLRDYSKLESKFPWTGLVLFGPPMYFFDLLKTTRCKRSASILIIFNSRVVLSLISTAWQVSSISNRIVTKSAGFLEIWDFSNENFRLMIDNDSCVSQSEERNSIYPDIPLIKHQHTLKPSLKCKLQQELCRCRCYLQQRCHIRLQTVNRSRYCFSFREG